MKEQTTGDRVEVTTRISKEEFIAGRRALLESQGLFKSRNLIITMIFAGLGLLGAVFCLWFLQSINDRFYAIALSILLIFPVLWLIWFRYIMTPRLFNTSYEKQKFLKAPISVRLSEKGLTVENLMAQHNYAWDDITDMVHLDEHVIFTIFPMTVIPIPTSSFTPQQLLELKSIYKKFRDPNIHEKKRKDSFRQLRTPTLITVGITLLFILIQLLAR